MLSEEGEEQVTSESCSSTDDDNSQKAHLIIPRRLCNIALEDASKEIDVLAGRENVNIPGIIKVAFMIAGENNWGHAFKKLTDLMCLSSQKYPEAYFLNLPDYLEDAFYHRAMYALAKGNIETMQYLLHTVATTPVSDDRYDHDYYNNAICKAIERTIKMEVWNQDYNMQPRTTRYLSQYKISGTCHQKSGTFPFVVPVGVEKVLINMVQYAHKFVENKERDRNTDLIITKRLCDVTLEDASKEIDVLADRQAQDKAVNIPHIITDAFSIAGENNLGHAFKKLTDLMCLSSQKHPEAYSLNLPDYLKHAFYCGAISALKKGNIEAMQYLLHTIATITFPDDNLYDDDRRDQENDRHDQEQYHDAICEAIESELKDSTFGHHTQQPGTIHYFNKYKIDSICKQQSNTVSFVNRNGADNAVMKMVLDAYKFVENKKRDRSSDTDNCNTNDYDTNYYDINDCDINDYDTNDYDTNDCNTNSLPEPSEEVLKVPDDKYKSLSNKKGIPSESDWQGRVSGGDKHPGGTALS